LQPMRDRLREVVALDAGHADEFPAFEARCRTSSLVAERATQQVEASGSAVTVQAERIREDLLGGWDGEVWAPCGHGARSSRSTIMHQAADLLFAGGAGGARTHDPGIMSAHAVCAVLTCIDAARTGAHGVEYPGLRLAH
jgi:hypothetical protein